MKYAQRRSRSEIRVDILRVLTRGDIHISKISREANTSYNRLKKDLSFLIEHGLVVKLEQRVKHTKITHLYSITSRGKLFLRMMLS